MRPTRPGLSAVIPFICQMSPLSAASLYFKSLMHDLASSTEECPFSGSFWMCSLRCVFIRLLREYLYSLPR